MDHSKDLHKDFESGSSRPALHKLSDALKNAIQGFDQTFIVIDALNEYPKPSLPELRKTVQQLCGWTRILITSRADHDMFRTQPKAEIKKLTLRENDDDVRILVDACIKRGLFECHELSRQLEESEQEANAIREGIVLNAQGLLLHAKLHLKLITECQTIENALKVVKQPPAVLGTRYKQFLSKIEAKDVNSRRLAMATLTWLTQSVRHLTIDELRHALAINADSDILDNERMVGKGIIEIVCEGLVVVEVQSNRVRFFHDSAYTYFLNNELIAGPTAKEEVALQCISYLMLKTFTTGCCETDEAMNTRLRKYPFYSYASQHWGHHVRVGNWTSSIQRKTLSLLQTRRRFESSIQARGIPERRHNGFSQSFTKDLTGLHIAALFGLEELTKILLNGHPDATRVDGEGKTALHIAAENGFHEIAHRLIRAESKLPGMRDAQGQSPLHLASVNGHNRAIAVLTKKGCKVDSSDNHGQTALHLAVLNGHLSTTERLLRKYRGSPNSKDHDGKSPLHIAAWKGDLKTAKELLLHGAEVDSRDKNGLTALHYASCMGHKGVVKLLLQRSAQSSLLDNGLWNSLHWAAVRRHDITDPWTFHLRSGIGPTFHTRAINKRIDEMLQLGDFIIISEEALVNTFEEMVFKANAMEERKRQKGRHRFLNKPADKMASLMIQAKDKSQYLGDVLFTMQDELSAMRCNTNCGHKEVADVLLSESVSVDTPTEAHWATGQTFRGKAKVTALHLALLSGHTAVSHLLISKGSDFRTLCHLTGKSSPIEWDCKYEGLHLAVLLGNHGIVERMLEDQDLNCRSDPNAESFIYISKVEDTKTTPMTTFSVRPIHLACFSQKSNILIPLLIKSKVDINAPSTSKSEDGKVNLQCQPLHLAVACGHESAANSLISGGSEVDTQCFCAMEVHPADGPAELCLMTSSLPLAILRGMNSTVEALLDKGVSPNSRSSLIRKSDSLTSSLIEISPIHLAIFARNSSIVQSLLERDGDPNVEFHMETLGLKIALTALHLSVLRSDEPSITSLCQKNADVNSPVKFEAGYELGGDNNSPISAKLSSHVRGLTALHLAILLGRLNAFQRLCDHKSDVNMPAEFHFNFTMNVAQHLRLTVKLPALHIALLGRNTDLFEKLLENYKASEDQAYIDFLLHLEIGDATVHVQVQGTFSAIHLATLGSPSEMAKMLAGHALDINMKSTNSVISGTMRMPKKDSNEEEVFETSVAGDLTPLHLAALAGQHDIVQVLLDNKADCSAQCLDGRTAVDIARDVGFDSVVNQFPMTECAGPSAKGVPRPKPIERLLHEHGVNLLFGDSSTALGLITHPRGIQASRMNLREKFKVSKWHLGVPACRQTQEGRNAKAGEMGLEAGVGQTRKLAKSRELEVTAYDLTRKGKRVGDVHGIQWETCIGR
ncbi:ankyrin repeat-containing protein [Fusarium napiforme]|uniref:Ankyrin repeat-containing protein n=1 Tax=Fusarium napiforme TaxID=42672 RepID=A0A8H5JCR9_9HYPO|nr:ankyrin repeat-containing protein [Fusarium napiforme]